MVIVTKKLHFSAAHRLFNPKLTEKENQEIFQTCNQLHGHNYIIEVSIKGNIDKETGYIVDLKIIKQIVEQTIINNCDHQYLNNVEFLRNVIPTVENLAECFFKILAPKIDILSKTKLYSIKLRETDKNWAEYRDE